MIYLCALLLSLGATPAPAPPQGFLDCSFNAEQVYVCK